MNTLLLTLDQWDLVVDANGNIAIASEPYSIEQDVASACRTFVGDVWYNQAAGIPYFAQILGQTPPLSLIKQWLQSQAAQIPGCNNPIVYISSVSGRTVTGQVQFTNSSGQPQTVSF